MIYLYIFSPLKALSWCIYLWFICIYFQSFKSTVSLKVTKARSAKSWFFFVYDSLPCCLLLCLWFTPLLSAVTMQKWFYPSLESLTYFLQLMCKKWSYPYSESLTCCLQLLCTKYFILLWSHSSVLCSYCAKNDLILIQSQYCAQIFYPYSESLPCCL